MDDGFESLMQKFMLYLIFAGSILMNFFQSEYASRLLVRATTCETTLAAQQPAPERKE